MARPRAANHDDKRLAILESAATLFAVHGYDRTSLTTLATACGMSKALLYHYYSDKSRLLFDIIHQHLAELLAVTSEVPPDDDPRVRLDGLVEALLQAYRTADAKHHIQISQMHLLPTAERTVLKGMERKLADRFAEAIAPCVPLGSRRPALLKPLTMSLFGMLNWQYLWFKDDGPMGRSDYGRLAVTLVIEGARKL